MKKRTQCSPLGDPDKNKSVLRNFQKTCAAIKSDWYLELRLAAGRLHRLHEPEPRILHRGNCRFLVLLELLVRLLELVHFVREELLRLLDLRFLLLDLRVKIRSRKLLEPEDLLLHLRLAEVHLCRAAHRLQTLGKLLKRGVVAPPLVILEVVRIAVLDRRVTADTHLVAQRLSSGRAVHVGNQTRLVVLERFHQLVPVRLHLLALASPGRQELDKDSLPGRGLVPSVGGELHAARAEREESQEGLHRYASGDRTCALSQ